MRELSLHVLDIVQNSLAAQADFIEININEDLEKDILEISIKDNGRGMSVEELEKVVDPFFTSRSTRKVGLGIPLFKANAEACNGIFRIDSQIGQGTQVYSSFQHSHIDRVPLGDIVSTIITVLASNSNLHLIYRHSFNGREFLLNTEEIRKTLDDIPLNNPLVINWLKEYMDENINNLKFPTIT